MKKYTFAYGRGSMDFEVDESLVIKEIRAQPFEVMKDINRKAGTKARFHLQ